jgi:hypothetical protein
MTEDNRSVLRKKIIDLQDELLAIELQLEKLPTIKAKEIEFYENLEPQNINKKSAEHINLLKRRDEIKRELKEIYKRWKKLGV